MYDCLYVSSFNKSKEENCISNIENPNKSSETALIFIGKICHYFWTGQKKKLKKKMHLHAARSLLTLYTDFEIFQVTSYFKA